MRDICKSCSNGNATTIANQKRILLLNHYDKLSPRLYLELKTLQEAGYSISVLLWNRFNCMDSFKSLLSIKDVEYIQLPTPRSLLKLLARLPKLYQIILQHLEALGQRFDAIHCTHIMLLPLAVWIKKRWQSAVIYDAYEFYFQEIAERLPKLLYWTVLGLRKLEDWLVRRTDGVLTVDSAGRELERRYSALQPNTAVLYNVPEAHAKLDKGKLKTLKTRYSGREIVLYVGGLSEAKGAIVALEAAQLVVNRRPQVVFLFVGKFQTDSARKLFQRKLAEYGLDRHVRQISWLPYSEMIHYVAISSVGLALYQPTTRYLKVGRGARKIFTYMHLGVPIVGPKFGEIGKILDEEGCGLRVDTTDPQEVAQAILYLLEHPDEAYKMGERGRKAIQERYNWELERQKLLAVYRRALQRRASEVRPSHEPSNGSSKESGS